MLTVRVERAEDVAVVKCAGRIVRGQEWPLKTAVLGEERADSLLEELHAGAVVSPGRRGQDGQQRECQQPQPPGGHSASIGAPSGAAPRSPVRAWRPRPLATISR